jgi:L,D-transpeptidase YcbB
MKRVRHTLLLLAGSFALVSATASPGPTSSEREFIRRALELGRTGPGIEAAGEPVYASEALPRFYQARGFAPAWVDDRGPLPAAREVVALLAGTGDQGLRPENYHLDRIDRLLAAADGDAATGAPPDAAALARLADLDLLLTDGALLCAAHLLAGVVDPVTIHPEWNARRRDADLAAFLASAIAADDLTGAFARLLPAYPGYRGLGDALARYRRIAADGGWPIVADGPALRPGDRDPRVAVLRHRLAAEGFAAASDGGEDADDFDAGLELAVRDFQSRSGLDADGVIGAQTLAALAVPAERRVEQLMVNLERWRWLPQDLGDSHLRVNIAGFELEERSGGRVVRTLRVVVGKTFTRTPVFSANMTYLVINPTWNVPAKIGRQEILAKVKKDSGYLDREGIRVFAGWSADAPPVEPATVDWAAISPAGLGYSFRQDPGPRNALGRLKFILPNPYDVYLHDTPERRLFDRATRPLSHGCIRVDHPEQLAADLLAADSRWTPERIRAAIDGGAQQTVLLPRPMPVHLLYWTAWVDTEGLLHFREDIYDRDRPVFQALELAPERVAPLSAVVGRIG